MFDDHKDDYLHFESYDDLVKDGGHFDYRECCTCTACDIHRKVVKGVSYLSDRFPGYTIDLDVLDVDNGCCCPLSQASGKPFYAIDNIDVSTVINCAFYISCNSNDDEGTIIRVYNDAWRYELNRVKERSNAN